jgi:hypothetical protein
VTPAELIRRFYDGDQSIQEISNRHGRSLLRWALAYGVAGPRPIEQEYPAQTIDNVEAIYQQMQAHRASMKAWEAKVEASLGESFWTDS